MMERVIIRSMCLVKSVGKKDQGLLNVLGLKDIASQLAEANRVWWVWWNRHARRETVEMSQGVLKFDFILFIIIIRFDFDNINWIAEEDIKEVGR